MQASALPASPAKPAAPVVGAPTASQVVNLDGLYAQRSELERQLSQMTDRREELANQRRNATTQQAASLDGRMAAMDARTARIEEQLAQVNEQIATAMATGATAARPRVVIGSGTLDPGTRRQIESAVSDAVLEALSIAGFTLLGVYVLWRGFRRFILRRKPAPPLVVPDHTAHLQALQQSMDAIAIEVERISEAQRFSAKLLKEKVRVE